MDPTINPKMAQLEPGMFKLYLDIEKSIPTNPCAEIVWPDDDYEEIEDLVD